MNSCVSFVRTRYVALAVLIPLMCATTTTARTWSDKSGKFRVDAEFVKVEDDVVSLKRTDTGATIQVPLARLSEADREHVRGLLDKPVAERRPQAAGATVRIEMPSITQSMATFAVRPGHYVLIDDTVFDTETGEKTGRIPMPAEIIHEPNRALSPDGRRHALCYLKNGVPTLEVANTETGNIDQAIALAPNGVVMTVLCEFIDPTHLAWVGRVGNFQGVRVYDATNGKLASAIATNANPFTATLHPNRKILAMAAPNRLMLGDLQQGRLVADNQLRDFRPYNLAFSPDGKQLAATSSIDGGTLLTFYDGRAVVLQRAVIPQSGIGRSPHREGLQWLPDGNGILVAFRYLIDRVSGKLAWELDFHNRCNPPAVVVDDNTVLTWERASNVVLKTVPIPRAEINAALAVMKRGQALLGPGTNVSIDIKISEVRFGTKADMEASLSEVARRRLEKSELRVAANANVVLAIDYGETPGPGTAIVQGWGPNPQVVGRTTQTCTLCKVALRTRDGRVLWQDVYETRPITAGEVRSTKPADLRKNAVKRLMTSFSRMNFPYFIPKDPELPVLPVRTSMRSM